MTTKPPSLSRRWLEQRRELHEAYLAVAGNVDVSHLAYLGARRVPYTNAQVAEFWAAQAARTYAQPAANHLYVHVPFCKSICSFCNYDRLRPGSADVMARWLDRVVESVEILGPATRGLEFHNLYLGGGTPSVLTAEMLTTLFTALDAHFRFHPHALRHFEFDPAAMNARKVEILQRFGFSRFSFGVQTLRPDVNHAHERGHQDRTLVEKRLDELTNPGASVNCDFLLGLAGTEPEAMFEEIREVMGMANAPQNIDVFVLVPTPAYVASHFGGSREAFEAHVDRFREAAPKRLAEIAAATGYRCEGASSHCFRMTRLRASHPGVRFDLNLPGYTQYTSIQGAPLNLLGIGTSARSHLFGCAQFEYEDPEGDVTVEGPGHFVGRKMSLADEARVFLLMRLRDRHTLDLAEFEAIFGASLDALLPTVMAALEHEAVIERDATSLRLRDEAPEKMLRGMLWVVTSEALEREAARHLGLDLPAGQLASVTGVIDGTELAGFRVRHEQGATCLESPAGSLRVRWAPVRRAEQHLEARIESTLAGAPPKQLLAVVRAMQSRLNRQLARRAERAARKLPVVA